MKINIVSNIREEKGLRRDYLLVRRLCEEAGHTVAGVDFRDEHAPHAGLTICMEICRAHLLGERNWIIPNPEWWWPECQAALPRFERILCKTRDGLRLMSAVTPRAELVGFMSDDRRDASVARERRFWHNAGGSIVKGTDAILTAWQRFKIHHPLTVVSTVVNPIPIPGVEYIGRLEDTDHRREQNRHAFHLCLSRYEGWGHYLHEGLSVGAVVASTDHQPLNEFEAAVRVPICQFGPTQSLATTGLVSAPAVRDAVERLAAMSDAEIDDASHRARLAYETETAAFKARWAALMVSL